RAAWRPGDEVCVVRAVVRQREVLLAEQAAWVLRMHKAMVQMNRKRLAKAVRYPART
ncbi:hypothetical protein GWC77_29050, partial [Paraburkholderia sp. NMBU_R16]|nr:hypothetical protein [Paraburkholderia sp. NMBU_R16]